MNKKSIQTKIIISLSLSIGILLLILFLMFNLLFSGFIKRQAMKDLRETISSISSTIKDDIGLLDNENRYSEAIKKLHRIAKTKLLFANQEFIIIDKKYQVLFPRKLSEGNLTRDDAILIVSHLQEDPPLKNKMKEVSVDKRHYYASMIALKPRGNGVSLGYVVLLSDVTGLSTFKALVNRVLLLSVLISGLTALFILFFFSTGLVHSIKKLCKFAGNIEKGDFTNQRMDFKEKELQQLSDDMNRMAAKLLEKDNQQKVFFQNVSHEFKTPLMSIQGYAEGIKLGIIESKDKACDIISHECSRLSEMVNDLLFISRFEAKENMLKKERTDVKVMLTDCCEALSGFAARSHKEIKLKTPEEDVIAIIDEEKFIMAVSNLVSNCIRHCQRIATVSCESNKKTLRIIVSDDGEGFDEKDLPHLFERFYKGKKGSSGLGLSIAESIIKAHNGTLSASNLIKGAQFQIELML